MNPAHVAERVTHVIDPDLGVNIVSLGLVYGIDVTPLKVRITLTATSPECPLSGAIVEAVREIVSESLPGGEVEVALVHEPAWEPLMMDRDAKRAFGWRDEAAGHGGR